MDSFNIFPNRVIHIGDYMLGVDEKSLDTASLGKLGRQLAPRRSHVEVTAAFGEARATHGRLAVGQNVSLVEHLSVFTHVLVIFSFWASHCWSKCQPRHYLPGYSHVPLATRILLFYLLMLAF